MAHLGMAANYRIDFMMKIKGYKRQILILLLAAGLLIFYQNCSNSMEAMNAVTSESIDDEDRFDDELPTPTPPPPTPTPAALSVPTNWETQQASLVVPSGCQVKRIGTLPLLEFSPFQEASCMGAFRVSFLSGKNFDFATQMPTTSFNLTRSDGIKNYTRIIVEALNNLNLNYAIDVQKMGYNIDTLNNMLYIATPDYFTTFIAQGESPVNYAGGRVDKVLKERVYSETERYWPSRYVYFRLVFLGTRDNAIQLIRNNSDMSLVRVFNKPFPSETNIQLARCASTVDAPFIRGSQTNPLPIAAQLNNGPGGNPGTFFDKEKPTLGGNSKIFSSTPYCYSSAVRPTVIYNNMSNPPSIGAGTIYPYVYNNADGAFISVDFPY
jgi:hypothetical protein